MKELKVAVAIPSGSQWSGKFGMSLCGMLADIWGQRVPGYDAQTVWIQNKTGSILPQQRHQLAEEAITRGATHVLFVDSDQKFPPYTLRRLLEHNAPVVACNIAVKKFPSVPTARLYSSKCDAGEVLFTRPGMRAIQKVWRVGTGVMLIETDVFKRLPKPWFQVKWKPAKNDFQGEDWWFCELCATQNIPIYVDQPLSWEIGHMGEVEFTHEMCLAGKVAEEMGVVNYDPEKSEYSGPLLSEIAEMVAK